MKLLDTNIIIRFFTRDNPEKAAKCKALFEKVVDGKLELFVSDLVIAEVVWILEKAYRCTRSDIREKIVAILNTPHLIFQNEIIVSEAVIIYDRYKIDYIDAYHKALMRSRGITEIISYDRDFDAFENDITRIEP